MTRRSPTLVAAVIFGCFGALALAKSGEVMRKNEEPISLQEKTSEAQPKEQLVADVGVALDASASVAPSTDPPNTASRRFSTLSDGSPVPPLPETAPQRVKLGIAIFRYVGSEAPPKSDRKKEEAQHLAQVAAQRGQTDFASAVQMGDRGSDENIGWIARGILEPAVEHAVFGLEVGKTSPEPIDSPRGYWVVRRVR